MADYCLLSDAKDMLAGQWGASANTGSGSTRDGILSTLVTRCSRMFDRETGRPTNFFAPATGAVRRYSGNGGQTLDIDEFNAITAVSMSSKQDRSDALTLTISDATSANYVQVLPISGPPFDSLFLLRGWLPDVFDVGNVAVTGDLLTPSEVTHAVAAWVAYEWKAREAGWGDAAQRPDGPGLLYTKGIPPETARIIAYYKDRGRGPGLAVIGATDNERRSLWLDWQTTP